MAQRWFVVNTKPRLETYASTNLNDQGFITFNPRYRQARVVRKKVITEVLPFYPTYIFVRFDKAVDPWKVIPNTRGVKQIITASEDSASPVPVGFVEDLILSADKEGYLLVDDGVDIMQRYMPGEELEIVDGPLRGMIGICKESSQGRVRIFLSLLSRQTEVSLMPSLVIARSSARRLSAAASSVS